MQNDNDKVIVGLAWFQPDQWARLKDVADDSAELDDSYQDWKKNANSTIAALRAAGNTVVRVNLNIDEVAGWCRVKGVPMTTATRAEFVSEKLEARYNKA